MADPSPFLLADLSLFFPFSLSFPIFTANYPEMLLKFYRGSRRQPLRFRETRTGFGLPLRDSPEFCYLFRFPEGMYNPDTLYKVFDQYMPSI